ncbi:MAG: flagellar motor stator protein MotA [Fimbriimonadaceae bacterium]|nr:flagellar motor stator protein MotA [Fimbriimonadaceae bacterium]
MFTYIGIVIALASMLAGYTMHHGQISALIVPSEYVTIFGMGIGLMIASNGLPVTIKAIKAALGLLKPPPSQQQFMDLLKMMFALFTVARKEGLLGLESHVENPADSEIIKKNAYFLANHHASDFFCDTMKVILTGSVGPHDLSEMMELDLEVAHAEDHKLVGAWQGTGDSMPAIGIVAAVLGIVITMGKIGGEAVVIGKSVGQALVGTFLGILSGYGFFMPIANSIAARQTIEGSYMNCIRHALFSFARGESPITCVEFARRNIDPTFRPGFAEMETAVKEKEAA